MGAVDAFEGTDISVYYDRTVAGEFYCSSGGTTCQTQSYLQLKSGFRDAVVFLRGFQVVDETSTPDRFEALRVSVELNNWDTSTGRLEWEGDVEFNDEGLAPDIHYTVEVTIILANRTAAGAKTVLVASEAGSNCSVQDTNSSSPGCTASGGTYIVVPGHFEFVGAPARSFSLSTSEPVKLSELGFEMNGVASPYPGAVGWSSNCVIEGKTAAATGTRGTCGVNRLALFIAPDALPWRSETTEAATRQTVGWSVPLERRNLTGRTGPFAGLIAYRQALNTTIGGGFGVTHLGGGCSAAVGVDPIYGWDMFYYSHYSSAQDVSATGGGVEFDPSVRCMFGEIR